MNADQMALEAMAMGSKRRNLDAAMDVELAVDENLLSPSVRAKALKWLSGSSREAFRPRTPSKTRFMAAGGYVGPRIAPATRGKGKRGWIKQGGRWVPTR